MLKELHQIFFLITLSQPQDTNFFFFFLKGFANGNQQRRVEVGLVIVTHTLTLPSPRRANQFTLGFPQKSVISL